MKNKFSEKLIILSWIIFFFICLGLLSFTSHAESSYFPMGQNDNNIFNQTILDYLDNNLDPTNNYVFSYIWSKSNNYYGMRAVTIPKDSANLYAEILSNGYQFQLYTDTSNSSLINTRLYEIRKYDNRITLNSYNGALSTFGVLDSSLYNSNSSYVSNFRLYSNNNTQTRQVVLSYGAGEEDPVGQGHAIPPDPFEDPTLPTGSNHTLPREVPESPTINNYTWITYNPPAIDTTNVESLLESLIYVINYLAGWLRDNLVGEFQNLISNISGLIKYIGETIQYYGGLIISNIQNGIETFYNNMVSLFEPISAKIDYLTEPVDGTIIYDNLSSTSLVTNINTINTSLTDFQDSFNNLSEPSSFTIPIHLENLPSAYFGNQTTQYIDLGVIGSTEKGLIRTFMWALTTYGLFITIVDSVSNYINGGGDES